MTDYQMNHDQQKVADTILKELKTQDTIIGPTDLKRKYNMEMSVSDINFIAGILEEEGLLNVSKKERDFLYTYHLTFEGVKFKNVKGKYSVLLYDRWDEKQKEIERNESDAAQRRAALEEENRIKSEKAARDEENERNKERREVRKERWTALQVTTAVFALIVSCLSLTIAYFLYRSNENLKIANSKNEKLQLQNDSLNARVIGLETENQSLRTINNTSKTTPPIIKQLTK